MVGNKCKEKICIMNETASDIHEEKKNLITFISPYPTSRVNFTKNLGRMKSQRKITELKVAGFFILFWLFEVGIST